MNKDFIEAFMKPFSPVVQNSFMGYALSQAILNDYCETISKLTGDKVEDIRKRILDDANNNRMEKLKSNAGWDLKETHTISDSQQEQDQ